MERKKQSLGLLSTRSTPKRKRITLTISEKMEILYRLESGEAANKLIQEYGIGSSTLYDLKSQKAQILKFYSETASKKDVLKRKNLRKSKFPQLDEAVFEWFKQQQFEGKPLSGPLIIQKAKELYDLMEIDEPCTFSVGWLNRFKDRHGIRKIGSTEEKISTDSECAAKFIDNFSKLIQEHSLTPQQIFNAGETGFCWRCLPQMLMSEEKPISEAEDLVTMLLCTNAAGYKCTPLVVGKSAHPPSLRNIENLPVIYRNSKNAWISQAILQDWFDNYFKIQVKTCFEMNGLSDDSLAILVLDNCKLYPETEMLTNENIFVMFLPSNIRSLIQPLDQGVIRTVKKLYRINFMECLINSEAKIGNINGFRKSYSFKDGVHDFAGAWESIPTEIIQNSWKNLLPSSVFEDNFEFYKGFEVNMKTTQAIKDLAKNSTLLKEIPDEVWDEWIDVNDDTPVTYHMPNEDIVECVLNPATFPEFFEADIDTHGLKKSFTNALKAAKVLIEFCESRPKYSKQEIMNIYQLESKIREDKSHFMKLLKESQKTIKESEDGTIPVCRPGTSSGEDQDLVALTDAATCA